MSAFVHGVGARSPYGLDALSTALVWRSGKLAPSATGWTDKRNQSIGSVRAKCLSDELVGTPRLVALAAPALAEAAAAAGARGQGAALLLATGEPRAGFDGVASLDTLYAIARAARVEIDPSRSAVVGAGHAGFALVLSKALELLAQPRSGPVIVGAVDSYHHPDSLRELDEHCRLLADGAADGIIPSEGAAFLVLANEPSPIAKVTTAALALEEGGTDEAPDLGKALCDVIRTAGAGASTRPLPVVYTDCNGERHRVRAWSFVRVRVKDVVDEDRTAIVDGPDDYGDAGAAMAALSAVRACVGFATGADEERCAMVVAMSESRERGAFVLEAAS